MFVNELKLYIDYYEKQVLRNRLPVDEKQLKYLAKFKSNLLSGIGYYRATAPLLTESTETVLQLDKLESRLNAI